MKIASNQGLAPLGLQLSCSSWSGPLSSPHCEAIGMISLRLCVIVVLHIPIADDAPTLYRNYVTPNPTGASAFSAMPLRAMRVVRSGSALSMTTAPPGYKPSFDGTFKKAGEHPTEFILEHENGSKCIVDTETATAFSWKIGKDGKELITSKKSAHFINGAPVKGHFVPEERAKKVSFDRMIFKSNPEDYPGLEYRVDVTMRENSLEYDVIIKNAAAETKNVKLTLTPNHDASVVKFQKKTGYTSQVGEASVETAAWDVPVGKLKETAFYALIK